MLLLHCLLAWLTGHWWGSRFGATWRNRIEPGWANRLFISRWFLRLGFILAGAFATDFFVLIANDADPVDWVTVVLCLPVGILSGVALGREAY